MHVIFAMLLSYLSYIQRFQGHGYGKRLGPPWNNYIIYISRPRKSPTHIRPHTLPTMRKRQSSQAMLGHALVLLSRYILGYVLGVCSGVCSRVVFTGMLGHEFSGYVLGYREGVNSGENVANEKLGEKLRVDFSLLLSCVCVFHICRLSIFT